MPKNSRVPQLCGFPWTKFLFLKKIILVIDVFKYR